MIDFKLRILNENILVSLFRSQKVAGTMQQLLGGDEIYHYHSKVTLELESILENLLYCIFVGLNS